MRKWILLLALALLLNVTRSYAEETFCTKPQDHRYRSNVACDAQECNPSCIGNFDPEADILIHPQNHPSAYS